MKFLILVSLSFFICGAFSKGCVHLDKFSFDKITSRFDAALIKFDNAYPYGEKHEAFETVCEDSQSAFDLVVGEVQVKDYGEKDNEELAQRFGIDKDKYPKVLLFIKGKDPIEFQESEDFPFNAVNLKKFIRTHTKIYIGLPGCLKDFDLLVKRFLNSEQAEKKNILDEAESLRSKLKEKEQKSAETYIKIMKKVLENGVSFVDSESARVENLLKGKLSKQKAMTMQERINILGSFRDHDEL